MLKTGTLNHQINSRLARVGHTNTLVIGIAVDQTARTRAK
jgi:D-ribose pyranose/furanose isomerase RbsD